MDQAPKSQETLRKLATIHQGFGPDKARLGLHMASASALDPKIVALIEVGVAVAIGSSPIGLQSSASRALAAGASRDEIVGVLLAVAPAAGLGRVVSAAPVLAIGLGYDIEAELWEWDDP